MSAEPTPPQSPSEDAALLRRYAATGEERAFTELVQRRIGLVYAVALRQTRGHRAQAEDATQAVFIDLARKAKSLAARPVIASWLYRSAQFAATALIRTEQRRLAREQEARAMEIIAAPDSPPPEWDRLRPVLDEALNEIDEHDRDVILLRFFDNRPFAEIGRQLRLTENTARMRAERALDKLHAVLARRGIRSTTAALGLALGAQAGVATPVGLVTAVTSAALAAPAATAVAATASFMIITKLQVGVVSAVAAALATGYVMQARTHAQLRREIAALQATQPKVAALRAENRQLAAASAEVETLRHDDTELKQLAQDVAEIQRTNREKARLAQTRAAVDARQAEIDRMNREGSALVEQYKLLNERLRDSPAGSARDYLESQVQRIFTEIQAKQREVQAYMAATGAPPPSPPAPDPEMARLNREGQALAAQARQLTERSNDPTLSPEERALSATRAQQKSAEIKAKLTEVTTYVAGKRATSSAGALGGTIRAAPGPSVPPRSGSAEGFTFRSDEPAADSKPAELAK